MAARRKLLLPLVPVYAAVLEIQQKMFDRGWPRQMRLEGPVISVGSISAGGAGKTPMVLMMAEVLEKRGYSVRILTRGYRRRSNAVEWVNPEGDADRYGDEPMLLARRSGASVYVGADRHRAGLLAQLAPGERAVVHLLDDGFQHRRLARDLDIVLLTRDDVDDVLLPAGDLREPLTGLRRADVVVLREEEAEVIRGFVPSRRTGMATSPIWRIRRSLRWPETASRPGRPMVFSGIARPEGFSRMLEAEGVAPVSTVAFEDHFRYRDSDVRWLTDEARRLRANGFITTEKDAVKLTPDMRRSLEAIGPLVVPELRVELLEQDAAFEWMMAHVKGLERRKHRTRPEERRPGGA